MRPSTAAQNAQIVSQNRNVSMTVAINGSITQWPCTDFQTDAQMTDTPAQISLLGGVAARQVTFKIDRSYSQAISPFKASIIPAAYPLAMGATVLVTVNFWPSTSRIGTPTYSANIFSGFVVDIPTIDGQSDISVRAQDPSYNLGTLVNLPAAGVLPVVGLDMASDIYYSSLAPIDLLLRGCGKYLTPPPVLTGANRTAYTILSIPGVGGNIPDVGTVVRQFIGGTSMIGVSGAIPLSSRTTGKFTPDVIGTGASYYAQTVDMAAIGAQTFQLYRMDFWFKTNSNASTSVALTFGKGCPTIMVDTTGAVAVKIYDGTINGLTVAASTGVNVSDAAWHHINVTISRPTATQINTTLSVDGVSFTSTTTVLATLTPFFGLIGDGTWLGVATNGTGNCIVWMEALEVIFVPLGATYTDPPDRNGQTAGITSSITATPTRLRALMPMTGVNAWQTIQAIAAAEGALAWFDDDGKFFFEPRKTWIARRMQTSSRTFDASSIANISMGINADGLRKKVTANYFPVTALASTAATPAYTADAVLTFLGGTTTTPVAVSQHFVAPAAAIVGASNVTGNSWFVPVDASTVGDPAAVVLTNVSISIVPTATGFDLTVVNPNRFAVSFWNPTDGVIPQGPALIIHGTRIVASNPITLAVTYNTTAKDDLALTDNPWRQDRASTQALITAAALDTFNAIPVLQSIDVPGDPRLQLGDIITIIDKRPNSIIQTVGGLTCVVTNIAHNVTPNNDYRMTLGIRPIGPPTGTLLNVAGRAELASTTYLPLPN